MKTDELDRLIHDCVEDCLSEGDAARLNAELEQSTEARARYWETASVHGMLENVLQQASLRVVTGKTSPEREHAAGWLRWRPLTAAAAGVVIGAFSATAVWAIAAGNMPHLQERELPLVDGGFEQSAAELPLNVPRKYGVWSGDPAETVSEFATMKPRSGRRMVRYLASASRDEIRLANNASDLWQVIPLPGSGERVVRVRAWFNAAAPASFTLAAVAGAEGPETAAELWEARLKGDPKVLAAGMKTVSFSAQTPGWQMAELLLQVPDLARVLVIDVAAHRAPGAMPNDGFPAQFVDDVSVTIADEPNLP